ncbi:hypothetical protein ACOJCX_003016 [Cronobacter dublinensis]
MSTISNERLEKLSEYDCADRYEVMSMATELLALRKEREKAEPVAWQYDWAQCVTCDGPQDFKPVIETEAPAEWAITDGRVKNLRKLYTAPPAPDIADDSLPYDPQIAEYEQMMEAEQAQADTASQQFESLAGKAVVPAGWKLVPIELTKEMRMKMHPFAEATCLGCGRQVVADCVDNVTASWNDMLAVAPEPCK